MSEKQFKLVSGGFDEKGNPLYLIKDTDMIGDYEICKKVIEQQSTISRLTEENDQLKKRNKFLQEFDGRACREENEKLEQKIKDRNKYQRVLEAKIRRLKDRIRVLEKNEW